MSSWKTFCLVWFPRLCPTVWTSLSQRGYWRSLSCCMCLVLDQIIHRTLVLFCTLETNSVFVVVGGWDDRQHRLPGPFSTQCNRDFPPQNLPALHPAASPRQRYNPGHTSHTHQQQFKGLYIYMCVCVCVRALRLLHEPVSVGGEWAESKHWLNTTPAWH